MPVYRSRSTIEAQQYTGDVIPGVVCDGNRDKHGCEGSRAHLPHVHSMANGGLTVIRPGDWIVAVRGGPFMVYPDDTFRSQFEVPEPVRKAAELKLPEVPVLTRKSAVKPS